jgi:hypothetical protein
MKIENALKIQEYARLGLVELDTPIYGYETGKRKVRLGTIRELLNAMEIARSMKRNGKNRSQVSKR